MKVSNEIILPKLKLPTLYIIVINCTSEINIKVTDYFTNRPYDDSKIKFIELFEIKNKCIYEARINVKIMLDFLLENKSTFKKHINLFNSIILLKSYLTDDDLKNDTPSTIIYFYDLDEKIKICPIRMIDEISYLFYHNPLIDT